MPVHVCHSYDTARWPACPWTSSPLPTPVPPLYLPTPTRVLSLSVSLGGREQLGVRFSHADGKRFRKLEAVLRQLRCEVHPPSVSCFRIGPNCQPAICVHCIWLKWALCPATGKFSHADRNLEQKLQKILVLKSAVVTEGYRDWYGIEGTGCREPTIINQAQGP